MEQIKTEFRKKKVGNSIYYSLFVNDIETNIYYPEIPSTFLLNTKEQAEREAELIRTCQVFPQDGNYENFDLCGTYYANLSEAKITDVKYNFLNVIYNVTGYENYTDQSKQDEVMKEIKNKIAEWTQWTKRINPETGELLHNVGVNFKKYGYTVFYY